MNLSLDLGHSPSGANIYWENANNPHIAVYGQSGSGKSYFLKKLLGQAAQQGALCLVLDYSGDFRAYTPPAEVPTCNLDVSDPNFSLNPLASVGQQDAYVCAQQLLCAIHGIFQMGSRASLKLHQITQHYLVQEPGIPSLCGLLQHVQTTEKLTAGLVSAMEPLELLSTVVHCGNRPIGLDLTAPGFIILGFSKIIDRKLRSFIIELILQAVWNQRICDTSGTRCPIILLLDECQNLSWDANSMAVRILREGRKYDLAGWFASQWIDNKRAAAALGQAVLQAHFRPEDQNIHRLARMIYPEGSKSLSQCKHLVESLSLGQFLLRREIGCVLRVQV